ncbi:DUF5949 family protein [Streptomyces sp. NPDC005202]|uniref:DUF5949 family protein n=1 Tax=Streptomyces sp. NPDC005202 TaxID=3157021 RepID=UPI0033BDBC77
MTSTTSETCPLRADDLGVLVALARSGEPLGGDMPYLLARSLEEGHGGSEATSSGVEKLLYDNGLPVGDALVAGSRLSCVPWPGRRSPGSNPEGP